MAAITNCPNGLDMPVGSISPVCRGVTSTSGCPTRGSSKAQRASGADPPILVCGATSEWVRNVLSDRCEHLLTCLVSVTFDEANPVRPRGALPAAVLAPRTGLAQLIDGGEFAGGAGRGRIAGGCSVGSTLCARQSSAA